ncbi:MFS transporter [Ferrovibrio sp.]|uniref:MFS transporter n=1 Tax=Ferrovibrio sp. TaxID=1917215 RepID=UPI0025BD4783|nr:MFS transporter [Ferrovibrio sp.]MBX3454215.1 MFS transporter [Ferrovibrio sp.]
MFYGWVVVAAVFTLLFVGFGATYTFPAFFEPLQLEFAATRGTISLVFGFAGFLYFILGILSGPLADHYGPRRVIGFGVLCMALGLAVAGMADSLIVVLLAYGLGVGVGMGFIYVPAIGTVQRWFVARRGQASGYAVMGIGLGTMAMPPLAAWVIDGLGWRQSYLLLSVGFLLLAGAATLVMRASPQAMGLAPDGAVARPAAAGASAPLPGFTLAQALRHPVFWWLYLASALCCIGTFVPFVHLAAYAQDQGLTRGQGVWLVGLIGVGSTLGRFVLGGLADRIGRSRSFALVILGAGVMLGYWLLASSFLALALFAIGFGIVYGGFVALAPAYMVDLFGARAASAVIGALYTSVAFGTLVGPTLAGMAFDHWGSYAVPILACAISCLIGAGIAALLPARLAIPEEQAR